MLSCIASYITMPDPEEGVPIIRRLQFRITCTVGMVMIGAARRDDGEGRAERDFPIGKSYSVFHLDLAFHTCLIVAW